MFLFPLDQIAVHMLDCTGCWCSILIYILLQLNNVNVILTLCIYIYFFILGILSTSCTKCSLNLQL